MARNVVGEILENEKYEEVTRAMGLTGFPLLMAQYLAKMCYFEKASV
jgi:hypothetical protein